MIKNLSGPGAALHPDPAASDVSVPVTAELSMLKKHKTATTREGNSLTKEIPAILAYPLVCPTCGEETDWICDTRSNNKTLAEAKTCGKCGTRWMDFYVMSRQV